MPRPGVREWCAIAEARRVDRPLIRAVTYDFWNTLIGEHDSPEDQRVDRVMVALASVKADVAKEALLAATAAAES